MGKTRAALWSVMALCSTTCADDTARKLELGELELRECKSSSDEGELATGKETASFAGLSCVAWRFSETGTHIDLINWREGCGFQGSGDETLWKAELEQSTSSAFKLEVFWDFSDPNACGSCLHDFSVSAERVAIADGDLALTVATRSCTAASCKWSERLTTLDSREGIECQYVDWAQESSAVEQRDRGKLGYPTRDGECDDPLVPTEINGADRCLKPCTTDDDCESPMICTNETCQLPAAK